MNSSHQNNFISRIFHWLESHWAIPAYGGWVLIGIALSFFGAATNTMAGWLYVLSGMLFSLLGIDFISSIANLKKIKINRLPIAHIYAGDELTLEMIINNPTKKSKILIEIIDRIPVKLGIVTNFFVENINSSGKKRIYRRKINQDVKKSNHFPIEMIPPQGKIKLTIYLQTKIRGIYHWQDLILKSAAPFGLFSSIRQHKIESRAVIYPEILSLHNCPLIDDIGNQEAQKRYSKKIYQNSTEGITKSLRQYRYGDAMRLIHWRSSARLGELQVRELETTTGGEEIIICLDNSSDWEDDLFEEAIKAVASMYFYASRQQLPINIWIGNLGMIHGNQVILETLAGAHHGEMMTAQIQETPVVWLSTHTESLDLLPKNSRYFLFPQKDGEGGNWNNIFGNGMFYNSEIPLLNQLQKPL